MKSNQSYYIDEVVWEVPARFAVHEDACAFLQSAGLKNPKLHVGKLYFFLNHLKSKSGKNSDAWVHISVIVMKKFFGNLVKCYYPVKKKLLSDGLIEIDDRYEVDKFCKRYRLRPELLAEKWVGIKRRAVECKTATLLLEHYCQRWEPVDAGLYRCLSTRFHIDTIDFFETTTEDNFLYHPCEMLDRLQERAKEKKRAIVNFYKNWKNNYMQVRQGVWKYGPPDGQGRRYNKLTNLPTILKRHLFVFDEKGNKQRLVSVDVCHSQPLQLLTQLERIRDSDCYARFKIMVEDPNFYEILAGLCALSRPEGKYKDYATDVIAGARRKELKNDFFCWLYDEFRGHDHIDGREVHQAMYDNFPEIVEEITFIKCVKTRKATLDERNASMRKRKNYGSPTETDLYVNGNKYLAQQMQKTESSIIIGYVCKNAVERGLCIAQIHDCILCLEQDVEQVSELICDGFRQKGLKVHVKVERNELPFPD
jgi:hypothetical protein